jgi:hypothetical protein
MGRACSSHGRDLQIRTEFCFESLKGRNHTEDIGVKRRIIVKWFLGK